MKIHTTLFFVLCILVTGCSSIDVIRKRTVSSILAEVHESGDTKFRKRVTFTGWVKHGFETSVVFGNRSDLDSGRNERSIWLTEPPPVIDTTWEDHSNERYTYQIFKATITGTVRSELRNTTGPDKARREGHMGMSPARLVDIDYTILSEIESIHYPWRKKQTENETEPNN